MNFLFSSIELCNFDAPEQSSCCFFPCSLVFALSALREQNLALTNTFSRTVSSQKQLWMGKLLRSISQRIKTTRIWAEQNFWEFSILPTTIEHNQQNFCYIFRITLRMKQEKQYLTEAKHTTTHACSANRYWSEGSVGSVLRRTNENHSQGKWWMKTKMCWVFLRSFIFRMTYKLDNI